MMRPLTTSPLTSWIIQVYLRSDLIQNVTINDSSRTVAQLNQLIPGTVYMIQVAGVNIRGIGNFSNFVVAQTYRGIRQINFKSLLLL